MKYKNYDFSDFAKDEFFRDWVFSPNDQLDSFWENFIHENNDKIEQINLARNLLLHFHEAEKDVDAAEIQEIKDSTLYSSVPRFQHNYSKFFLASVAAIVAILITSFFFIRDLNETKLSDYSPETETENEIITLRNIDTQTKTYKLSDGSKITLFPKSSLQFRKEFSLNLREVYLNGKAHFSISKDAKRPFWVYTKYITTQVLGTSFTIDQGSLPELSKVEVESGKVSVYMSEELKKNRSESKKQITGLVITPNQGVIFDTESENLVKIISSDPKPLIINQKENFVFESQSVSTVFNVLSKSYGINIIFDENQIANCFISADLQEESFIEKIEIICKIAHATYEKFDCNIIIKSKGC